MKYIIGLDLGINNVGWSIVNQETNEIVDCGVVRYQESSDAQERRKLRASRRLRNRRLHRVERLALLFKENGIPTQRTIEPELITKRAKGLKEELSVQEIVNIIYYFAMHRGYIPFDDEKQEREVVQLDDNQFPCEFIINEFKKYGKYRNSNKLIKCSDNIREIKQILETQRTFHPELTPELTDKIIKIITCKREFYEGPGGARINQLTPYGRFRTAADLEEYKVNPQKYKYLYEKLIAKCKIALGETCAPRINYFAEEFNFLNDFINMKVKDVTLLPQEFAYKVDEKGKLSGETILEIRDYVLSNETVRLDKMFKQILGTGIENIEGYRIDKNKKPEVSLYDFYKYVIKQFSQNNLNPTWLYDKDKKIYNKTMYVLTVVPSSVQIEEMLIERIPEYSFSQEEINVLKGIKTKKITNNRGMYHSLSEKVLLRTLADMKKTQYQFNYMQLMKELDYEKEAKEYFEKNYTNRTVEPYLVEKKYIDVLIANPQVKKTLRKAISVINAIIKRYKEYPTVIAIESTREMNSKAKKDAIIKEQAKLEKLRKDAITFLEENDLRVNETNILKAMCYKETNGHCMYCNTPIPASQLSTLEIEHILPISQSYDDSFDNITCACLKCNMEKLKKTPYEFLMSINSYEPFKERVIDLPISDKKKNNLLFEGDISKYELKFINRNLRDTAYGSMALAEELRIFNVFLERKANRYINIVTIPGQMTSKMRRKYELEEKDRTQLYHHAVDATIVASIANTPVGRLIIKGQNDAKFWFENKEKRLELSKLFPYAELENIKEIKELIPKKGEELICEKDDRIKRSFEVKKSINQQIANQNIVKYKIIDGEYYLVQQINNIYEEKSNDIFYKLFDESKKDKILLCELEDPKLYNRLREIFYAHEKSKINPFLEYCLFEHGIETTPNNFNYLIHGIKKSPNKPNSPIVKKLRYLERKTNPYIFKKADLNRKRNNFGEFVIPKLKDKTINGLDSLSQYCVEVYYDSDAQRFIFLPIYMVSVDINSKKINREEHYYKETVARLIGKKTPLYITTLYTGNWCKVVKRDSSFSQGRFICYHKTHNKLVFGKDGSYSSSDAFYMTTNDKQIIIYGLDILGKKYKILDSNDII